MMDKEYLKLCEKDEIINSDGLCIVCGKQGMHSECEMKFVEERNSRNESLIKRRDQQEKIEKSLVKKYAISGDYGISDLPGRMDYAQAKSKLDKFISTGHAFDGEKIIENYEWWFFPYYYTGMFGYIVEKASGAVYVLGTGHGNYKSHELGLEYSHWNAILAYLDGHISSL